MGFCAGSKPSWTARLLGDPTLLCSKVREEAGELCQTLEAGEGRERAASEAADLLYHALVLLNLQARRCPHLGFPDFRDRIQKPWSLAARSRCNPKNRG